MSTKRLIPLGKAFSGKPKTVRVRRGGITFGSASFAEWGEAQLAQVLPTINVTIAAETGWDLFAPRACRFRAVVGTGSEHDAVSDPILRAHLKHNELFYRWDYGMGQVVPARYGEALRPGWNDLNIGVGPLGTVRYETPGSRTVKVWVYDRQGNWGTAEVTINVTSRPWTDAQTFVVAADGNFAGAPTAVAANQCATFDDAIKKAHQYAMANGVHTSVIRILLKAGQTHVCNSVTDLQHKYGSWTFDRWGTGADPLLDTSQWAGEGATLFSNQETRALRWRNINWKGAWDPLLEKYTSPGGSDLRLMNQNHNRPSIDILLDNSQFRNQGSIVLGFWDGNDRAYSGNANPNIVVIHNCLQTDHKDFFCFIGKGSLTIGVSMVGFKCIAGPNISHGGSQRYQFGDQQYSRNSHNGIRSEGCRSIHFAACHMEPQHGWTTQGDIFFLNTGLRFLTADPGTGLNQLTSISRSFLVGPPVADKGSGGSEPIMPISIVMEQCTILTTPTIDRMQGLLRSGWTIRDCYYLRWNIEHSQDTGPGHMITENNPGNPEAGGLPNRIYNNTIEDRQPAARQRADYAPFKVEAAFPDTKRGNNMFLINERADLSTAIPTVDVDTGYNHTFPGLRRTYDKFAGTFATAVAPGGSVVVPYGADFAGRPVNQASYSAEDGRHTMNTGGAYHHEGVGCEVVFGASGVTVTNTSEVTWAQGATFRLFLSRGANMMALDTRFAFNNDVVLKRPTQRQAVDQTQDLYSLFDLDGNVRPGTKHPDSPFAAAPTIGALEPAL